MVMASSQVAQFPFDAGKRLQRMGGCEMVDERHRSLHGARHRLIAYPAEKRIEPDQSPRPLLETRKLRCQRLLAIRYRSRR